MNAISPFTFVIFGATGDLTKRKLIPALYNLFASQLLPDEFRIFGFARRPIDTAEFIDSLLPFIDNKLHWQAFASHIHYIQGDFSSLSGYDMLRTEISQFESSHTSCSLRMYYMAVAPTEILTIVENLGRLGMHEGCGEADRWSRIIVEKPFGSDLNSAQTLNAGIKKYFQEEQIYRIDHYLGKETVQNILSVRFANVIFEPVWNREYIESIEIHAYESLGVEDRGGYYDTAGALRDMVQSHLLQVLALTLMEQPLRYDAHEIRSKKHDVLRALLPLTPQTINRDTVRAQYTASSSHSVDYTQEPKINPSSTTETFVGIRAFVDLDKWRDVPIIIRTGKKLSERRAEIIVTFRRSRGTVFSNLFCELRSNTIKIRLQPDEGVKVRMLIKEPGMHMKLSDAFLDYKYSDTFGSLPDSYDRLIIDALNGDQSLFTRTDEIESSWSYVSQILDLWNSESVPLLRYPAGSNGPDFKSL